MNSDTTTTNTITGTITKSSARRSGTALGGIGGAGGSAAWSALRWLRQQRQQRALYQGTQLARAAAAARRRRRAIVGERRLKSEQRRQGRLPSQASACRSSERSRLASGASAARRAGGNGTGTGPVTVRSSRASTVQGRAGRGGLLGGAGQLFSEQGRRRRRGTRQRSRARRRLRSGRRTGFLFGGNGGSRWNRIGTGPEPSRSLAPRGTAPSADGGGFCRGRGGDGRRGTGSSAAAGGGASRRNGAMVERPRR